MYFNKASYRLFGGYARANRYRFFDLELSLKKANINTTVEVYLSDAILKSILAALIFSLICFILALDYLSVSPEGVLSALPGSLGEGFIGSLAISHIFLLFLAVIVSFTIAFSAIFTLLTGYPKYIAGFRESDINLTLPHAATFMYAMSKGGMSPLDVFRAICEHNDIYGETAVEMETVVRGVDLLGYDLITSIKYTASTTPSGPMKNFLESMASLMESGGDLSTFLHARAEQFRNMATQEQKILMDMLSMFSEIYVTAFVAGPLFLITIMVVMGMISQSNMAQLQVLVYLLIPVASLFFIWFLYGMGLGDGNIKLTVGKKVLDEYNDAPKSDIKNEGKRLLKNAGIRFRLKKFLDSPASFLINDPIKVLYFSIPLSIIIFLFFYRQSLSLNILDIPGLDDAILLIFVISAVPFVVFWELRCRKIKSIEVAVPELLKRLASMNESGLTLALAIKTLLRSNLGVLNAEIKRICLDMDWGADTKDALVRFETRVNVPSIRRMVTLITKASESTGNIKDTLDIAASDAAAALTRRQDRFSNMLFYISIIYISFFVFLYIIHTLTSVFLPVLPGVPVDGNSQALTEMGISMGAPGGIAGIRALFYHSVLIQAFFSGIVAGMMGEGNVFSGLKHSLLMMAIGFVVFLLFI